MGGWILMLVSYFYPEGVQTFALSCKPFVWACGQIFLPSLCSRLPSPLALAQPSASCSLVTWMGARASSWHHEWHWDNDAAGSDGMPGTLPVRPTAGGGGEGTKAEEEMKRGGDPAGAFFSSSHSGHRGKKRMKEQTIIQLFRFTHRSLFSSPWPSPN